MPENNSDFESLQQALQQRRKICLSCQKPIDPLNAEDQTTGQGIRHANCWAAEVAESLQQDMLN